MKKQVMLVLSAALVFGGTTATPAAAADEVPTNVRIAWKDDTFQFVRVSWSESAAQPNRIIVRERGETTERAVWYVPADAPNVIDLPKKAIRQTATVYEVLEIGVAAGTESGATSATTASAPFDILYPAQTLIGSFGPSGTSTLRLGWQGWERAERDTPGDPLDTDRPMVFHPTYRVGTGAPVAVGKPTTATAITFTGPKPPFDAYVWSENEWDAGSPSDLVRARSRPLTTSIPKWVLAGTDAVISGSYGGPSTAKVTLQARNSATSPWYVVGAQDASANKFRFAVRSQGTRQYRVALDSTADYHSSSTLTAWYGGYSPAVTTTTQMTIQVSTQYSAVRRGSARVHTLISVAPAVAGLAQLQRWNGKTWTLVGYVPLSSGQGEALLSTNVAGRFAYRFYVPTQRYHDLPVAAAYSPNFVLTVNP